MKTVSVVVYILRLWVEAKLGFTLFKNHLRYSNSNLPLEAILGVIDHVLTSWS